jgi:multimeric flavodoxin WrbA
MHSADGLVFASPGYSAMVSGLFKNFLDRFMYLDHIPEFIGVPVSIICTSGGDGVNGAPDFTSNNAITWWGCNIVNKIGIAHAFYYINNKYRKKTEMKLQKAADKMHREISEKPKRSPTFRQYMYFMFNKVELQISSTVMPYRMKVWDEKGWIKADYYYKAFVNPLYKTVCFFLFSYMKIAYRFLLGKNGDAALADWVKNN